MTSTANGTPRKLNIRLSWDNLVLLLIQVDKKNLIEFLFNSLYATYTTCYESPKKEIISHTFKHLIHNIKSYNKDKI